jgi:hypothetical protein
MKNVIDYERSVINQMNKPIENEELKILWENKSFAYNSIFKYLKNYGLKEKELTEVAVLITGYLELI